MNEPVPCGSIASVTHCCEYHAIHSDDDFDAALKLLAECIDETLHCSLPPHLKERARALIDRCVAIDPSDACRYGGSTVLKP